jgi:hypothetical protein
MGLPKVISVFILVAACFFGAASANAKSLYVSGNSNRTTGGTSCGDALSVAWFNDSASWGWASHQISPGTTVYLCGAFNGRPGEELLTVRGSGSAGNPITIQFLQGTVLAAPYWSSNGAIHMDGVSDIVVDGGANGVIENTANGTGRAYRQESVAIHAGGCTDCTVRNLTIQNLYVRTSASDMAPTHAVNCVYWHNSNNLTVSNITCHDATWALAGDGSNFTLENSNIYHVDHGVASGPAGKIGGYKIHNNHFHDFANWDSPSNTYHHDGIHLWGERGGTVTSGAIYNNTFDGDFGANITAHVFLQESVQHVAVFNNVCATPIQRTIVSVWFYAPSTSLPGGPATGNSAYHNSVNAGGHRLGSAIIATNQLQFTAVNNIMSGGVSDISLAGNTTLSAAGVNHNVYRDLFAEFGDVNTFSTSGKYYRALPAWQAACHCDFNSKLITGAQTTAFSAVTGGVGSAAPQAGSAVVKDSELDPLLAVGEGNGLNLSELAVDALAPLAINKNGVPRPPSGPWNVGPF